MPQIAGLTPSSYREVVNESLSDTFRQHLVVSPLPRNMQPEHNRERRLAIVKTLIDLHRTTEQCIVDAADVQHNIYVAATMPATTECFNQQPASEYLTIPQAGEDAIDVAITDPQCTAVLSDSKTASLHYARNTMCAEALRILRGVPASDRGIYIKLFPAHMDMMSRGRATLF
ncbi:hypothetical protein HPB48_014476 [Haemaphysalis longicornis]|uniref:Uncharacterized protein n=1 Tax=Haemaphysalis longicornis TaxID=44386 RepID=A0A9J6FXM0_HAELO|nr:hypothetical protein HPB48_014476 [Haemaphysalis longicornis]